jgi:hypothetical protein
VDPVKPAPSEPVLDRLPAEAEFDELRAADDTVLGAG